GDAPYADAYKRQVRALAAADERIVFTGFQFGEAYAELQSHAACYVQATEVGGTHPALVEAMGTGRCVIANATPENLEVIGDAGLSYEVNDVEDLRTRLRAVRSEERRVGREGAQRGGRGAS